MRLRRLEQGIIQQFENQLIYPLVVRKIVGVPPIISIVALIVGGKLAGFVGLIISVPLATMLMEFLGDIEKHKIAERLCMACLDTYSVPLSLSLSLNFPSQ